MPWKLFTVVWTHFRQSDKCGHLRQSYKCSLQRPYPSQITFYPASRRDQSKHLFKLRSLFLKCPFDFKCDSDEFKISVAKNFILKSALKTSQLDLIPTPLLVECLDVLLISLTALVNSSLSSSVFPEVFKTALVTPVLKQQQQQQQQTISWPEWTEELSSCL